MRRLEIFNLTSPKIVKKGLGFLDVPIHLILLLFCLIHERVYIIPFYGISALSYSAD